MHGWSIYTGMATTKMMYKCVQKQKLKQKPKSRDAPVLRDAPSVTVSASDKHRSLHSWCLHHANGLVAEPVSE